MVTPSLCFRQQWSYVPAGVYDFPLGQEQISQLYSAVPVQDATPANEVDSCRRLCFFVALCIYNQNIRSDLP